MSPRTPLASDAIVAGAGDLPKVCVTADDGARFEAYLHGAHVASWRAAGSDAERLYLSPLSRFAAGAALRGGVPVCFPQFADQGPLPMHGFARTTSWTLGHAGRGDDGAACATFRLDASDATRALWPHAFACELSVHARGAGLRIALAVTNTGTDAFPLTMALHTYLRVGDVRTVRVHGLAGVRFRDKVRKVDDVVQGPDDLVVDRPLDRVYRAVPDVVTLREPARALSIHAEGTTDTVVWNPGPDNVPADMPADDWTRFVCIEAAVSSAPVVVAPGATWRASQTLSAAP